MKPILTKSSWTNGPPTSIIAFSVLELSRRGHHLAGLANVGYCEDFKKINLPKSACEFWW